MRETAFLVGESGRNRGNRNEELELRQGIADLTRSHQILRGKLLISSDLYQISFSFPIFSAVFLHFHLSIVSVDISVSEV